MRLWNGLPGNTAPKQMNVTSWFEKGVFSDVCVKHGKGGNFGGRDEGCACM